MTRLTQWTPPTDRMTAGAWVMIGADTAEALSLSAFDFIALDAQHGSFTDAALLDALHRCPPARTDVFVRVPRNDEAAIGRALDAGARGVIVPMVSTAEHAAFAAAACRYPDAGARSWGQFGPRWGRAELSPAVENARVVCGVMIENLDGVSNAAEIAATPGVDMIFVGPLDLSISLGTTVDDLLAAAHDGALGTILAACAAHDVIPAAFAGTPERAAVLHALGFQLLAVTTDVAILQGAGGEASSAVGYA